jgi:hypothetical protein
LSSLAQSASGFRLRALTPRIAAQLQPRDHLSGVFAAAGIVSVDSYLQQLALTAFPLSGSRVEVKDGICARLGLSGSCF